MSTIKEKTTDFLINQKNKLNDKINAIDTVKMKTNIPIVFFTLVVIVCIILWALYVTGSNANISPWLVVILLAIGVFISGILDTVLND
jgi:RsiW-degrading membrane proteinase PrsW (M82 family)